MENRKRVLIEAAIAQFTQKEMCLTVEAIVAYLNARYSITKFSVEEVEQIFREQAGGAA
jgi:hypothetical protein